MTNIRKHGFENDAQWREYLEEIEEETLASPTLDTDERLIHVLADLRTEIDILRQRIQAYMPRKRSSLGGSLVATSCLLAIFAQTLLSVSGHVLVDSVYPEATLLDSLIAMPLAGAAAFFPLSIAGAGARDLVLVTLYGTLGIPRAEATATALALLLVTLLVGAIGGVLQLLAPLTPPGQSEPPPDN